MQSRDDLSVSVWCAWESQGALPQSLDISLRDIEFTIHTVGWVPTSSEETKPSQVQLFLSKDGESYLLWAELTTEKISLVNTVQEPVLFPVAPIFKVWTHARFVFHDAFGSGKVTVERLLMKGTPLLCDAICRAGLYNDTAASRDDHEQCDYKMAASEPIFTKSAVNALVEQKVHEAMSAAEARTDDALLARLDTRLVAHLKLAVPAYFSALSSSDLASSNSSRIIADTNMAASCKILDHEIPCAEQKRSHPCRSHEADMSCIIELKRQLRDKLRQRQALLSA